MQRKVRVVVLTVLLMLVSALGAGTAIAKTALARCHNTNLRPRASNRAAINAATLCLINQVRTAHHLRPLRASHKLQAVAIAHTNDMLRYNYFSDTSPSGKSSATEAMASHQPPPSSFAEDIGWGTGRYATPANMVRAWMNSFPHRRVILTRAFRAAGIGAAGAVPSVIAQDRRGATYSVEFGTRSP